MKTLLKICLLTVFGLILSSCSSVPKDWTGISQDEITAWSKGGFIAKDAQTWKAKGFTAVAASSWRAGNFDLDKALKWTEEGFKAEEAIAWKKIKFSLKEAKAHRAKGLMPISLQNPAQTTKQDTKPAQTEAPEPEESTDQEKPADNTPAEPKRE